MSEQTLNSDRENVEQTMAQAGNVSSTADKSAWLPRAKALNSVMMFEGQHVYVIDAEVLRSPDSCRYCRQDEEAHISSPRIAGLACPPPPSLKDLLDSPPGWGTYTPLGWTNKAALGISIGCAWDSRDGRTYFFDEHNLQDTMQRWVDEQPLIVTFNGISFDLPLFRAILRRRAEENVDAYLRNLPSEEGVQPIPLSRETLLSWHSLTRLCDAFKLLCATSYDILAECWKASPESKRVKGLNGLGALAEANGYGGKTGNGADAPRLWAAGKCAEVANYCANDVYLTKALFEQIQRGEPLRRRDGSTLLLPKV